jgi:putative acetyltransferase
VAEPAPPRAVTDRDRDGLVGLVGAAYGEHPGCVLDLPGVDADLQEPATVAARRGGRWWVVDDGDRLVASVGTGPRHADGSLELKRLYVATSHRRRGLARSLVARVERHASKLGATTIELWSDTRFRDAHRLYEGLGYRPTGETRVLHDPSDTTEYRFERSIVPSAPDAHRSWVGPDGADTCQLFELPDGFLLRGHVGPVGYRVEVDAYWRTRLAEVSAPSGALLLTSDGHGRWWREGVVVPELTGCVDADIEVTPATNVLPIRRAGGRDVIEVTAAWIRLPGPDVGPLPQRYTRVGPARWTYGTGSDPLEITVDDDGFPVRYGDLWRRA